MLKLPDPAFNRFPERGQALPVLRLGALLAAAVAAGRFLLRVRHGFAVGELGAEQPVAVIVQVAVERRQAAVGDDQEFVGGGAQQVPVMGDNQQRALELRQRLGQRLPSLKVEVVGRLVQQQQVGTLPDNERQRQPRLLAT